MLIAIPRNPHTHYRRFPLTCASGVHVMLTAVPTWSRCFWQDRLPEGREAISWEKVLQLLVVNRLIDPGSEPRVHRHWFFSRRHRVVERRFRGG